MQSSQLLPLSSNVYKLIYKSILNQHRKHGSHARHKNKRTPQPQDQDSPKSTANQNQPMKTWKSAHKRIPYVLLVILAGNHGTSPHLCELNCRISWLRAHKLMVKEEWWRLILQSFSFLFFLLFRQISTKISAFSISLSLVDPYYFS